MGINDKAAGATPAAESEPSCEGSSLISTIPCIAPPAQAGNAPLSGKRWYSRHPGEAPPNKFNHRCLNNPGLDPAVFRLGSCARWNCPLHGWGPRVKKADALVRALPQGYAPFFTCIHLNCRGPGRVVGAVWRALKKAITRAVGKDHVLIAVPGFMGVSDEQFPYVHLHVFCWVSPSRARAGGVAEAMTQAMAGAFGNRSIRGAVSGVAECSCSHKTLILDKRCQKQTTPRISADTSGETWAYSASPKGLLIYALRARPRDRDGIPPEEQPGTGGRYMLAYVSDGRPRATPPAAPASLTCEAPTMPPADAPTPLPAADPPADTPPAITSQATPAPTEPAPLPIGGRGRYAPRLRTWGAVRQGEAAYRRAARRAGGRRVRLGVT